MSIALKQIVYNLEDYGGSGGLISTCDPEFDSTLGELIYSAVYQNDANITSEEGTFDSDAVQRITHDLDDYNTRKINIYDNNILYGFSNVKKIGIQAPPGTKFTFSEAEYPNASEYLMVGRTGIYELNDDIVITFLRFQRPKNYVLNKELSQQLQSKGTGIMKSARDTFLNTVNDLTKQYGQAPDRSETGSGYWNDYNTAHQKYVQDYKSGLGLYLKGKAGVYEDGSEDDLYNIIIDFTYGEESN